MIDPRPNKNLGQHWLHDQQALIAMCDAADVGAKDVVLEIGPGLGTLTEHLVNRAGLVQAVEFDEVLAAQLPGRITAENLQVEHADFLSYDLRKLPAGYKVVANVPYYITSKIVRQLLESVNPPIVAALLVQKEVAKRMAAQPGQMSILAVAVQFYAEPQLGRIVQAELFTPPPKVDSQIIILRKRPQPLFPDIDQKLFFRVVRAGFGEKRKQLRNSLAGAFHISKQQADHMLQQADIPPTARAEQLSMQDWHRLTRIAVKEKV